MCHNRESYADGKMQILKTISCHFFNKSKEYSEFEAVYYENDKNMQASISVREIKYSIYFCDGTSN